MKAPAPRPKTAEEKAEAQEPSLEQLKVAAFDYARQIEAYSNIYKQIVAKIMQMEGQESQKVD